MPLPLRIGDAEIDASASQIATAVLEHRLARRLGLDVWAVRAIAAGDPSIRPADARRILRLAMAAIDSAEIALGLELRP
jgi:hypothetical protein